MFFFVCFVVNIFDNIISRFIVMNSSNQFENGLVWFGLNANRINIWNEMVKRWSHSQFSCSFIFKVVKRPNIFQEIEPSHIIRSVIPTNGECALFIIHIFKRRLVPVPVGTLLLPFANVVTREFYLEKKVQLVLFYCYTA